MHLRVAYVRYTRALGGLCWSGDAGMNKCEGWDADHISQRYQ